ncbi:ESPR-type extended signal peptide-containing protein, partial [Stenotrophomonas sp.]|uniref:ESPR-type extended signal peptide-containing protein n=1 Tax=Stenotrophomonas sp. TaxID=69392 RepID=UPI0025F19C25
MNRIYRKVWNKALGQMVVASELASSQSSGVVIDQRRTSGGRNTALLSAAIALTLGLSAAGASQTAYAQSVEVGGNANCLVLNSNIVDSCVVDGNATASGTNAVAIGSNSTASGANSVALGAGSKTNRANTVSVGDAGKERQVTNVAAGTAATDAFNKPQLDRVAVAAEGATRYFKADGDG